MLEAHPIHKSAIQHYLQETTHLIGSLENILIKRLFVLTFQTLSSQGLGEPLDRIDLHRLCVEIVNRLDQFERIDQAVLGRINEACFEEVCFYYFTIVASFRTGRAYFPAEKVRRKMGEDIQTIRTIFEKRVSSETLR